MAIEHTQHDASHPANRPVEPDHPMMLNGSVVPGQVELMARCVFEELLMIGTPREHLRAMTHDPEYQALHAMRDALGSRLDELLDESLRRVGVHHLVTHESRSDVRAATLTVNASGH
jgi:hypothetical protein